MCKLTTTLAALRKEGACVTGYNRLVRTLQGQEFIEADKQRVQIIRFAHKKPISLLTILDSNGVDDCLWSLRAAVEPERDYLARMIAADCAESVLHLFTAVRPDDLRPQQAIDAARAFARGEIDAAARAAAWDAAWDAERVKQSTIIRTWLSSENL